MKYARVHECTTAEMQIVRWWVRALVPSCVVALLVASIPQTVHAQTRLAILQAEDRRAASPRDLATLRAGAVSGDPQTRRIAIRALGRLERPVLIADIVSGLRAPWPEIRAEAANAIGQAAQGKGPFGTTLESLAATLATRLSVEADADVREALCETIGRLPYTKPEQIEQAEAALVDEAGRNATAVDRLGVANGLESLGRIGQKTRAPGSDAIALLKRLAAPSSNEAAGGARVRRLALEALTRADAADNEIVERGLDDADAQVRRLAVRAAASSRLSEGVMERGLKDQAPMVRIEALRSLSGRKSDQLCPAAAAAAGDVDIKVALVALDQLRACGSSSDATALLDRTARDLSTAGAPRSWHRGAHALVALAVAAPDRASAVLPQFTGSTFWQMRMYAARAAVLLENRAVLETLAQDADDNVREAAVTGLSTIAGHGADDVYLRQLGRTGYQILRAAALALDGTPKRELAIPMLKTLLARLVAEDRDNAEDVRAVIAGTLTRLGAPPSATKRPTTRPDPGDLTAENLRRYASPRARVTIRAVGTIDLALIASEAPATVLRFIRLAQSGYYNGLTIHRVEPNFVVQGGSPGANEYIGDAAYMRDEIGRWPHVRGAAGISTRGRDTGDAQIFINLVDNARFDHEYTVFGQVLNGIEVADQILEGDIIDGIEIVPG